MHRKLKFMRQWKYANSTVFTSAKCAVKPVYYPSHIYNVIQFLCIEGADITSFKGLPFSSATRIQEKSPHVKSSGVLRRKPLKFLLWRKLLSQFCNLWRKALTLFGSMWRKALTFLKSPQISREYHSVFY